MKNQPTLQDVLQAVQALPTRANYQDVLQAVQALPTQADFKVVTSKVDDLAEAVQLLASQMDERFSDVHSEMATKKDLVALENRLENRLVTEIDRFVVLHQKLDVEYISLRRRCERIETHVGMTH